MDQPLRWKAKPIANVDRGVSQAIENRDDSVSGMRPIKLVSGYAPLSSSPVGSGVVQAGGANVASVPRTPSGGWNKMRVDSYVTPAQATSAADPFSDPFNDRQATRTASALQLQGPAGQLPNPAAPGTNPNAPGYNPVQPAPTPAPPQFDPAPFRQPPSVAPPTQPGAEQPPVFPRGFDPAQPPPSLTPPPDNAPPPNTPPNIPPENVPPADPAPRPMPSEYDLPPRRSPENNSASNRACDRIYNDLNCCDSADGCRAFIRGLFRDKLSNISLDIAPRFDTDDTKNEEQRASQSKFAGRRVWYRRGVTIEQRSTATPLAEGTLHDLQNGRAIIVQDDGQKRDIPLNDLSEDDLCFISGWWRLPAECAIAGHRSVDLNSRGWNPSTMNWTASALCHKPLYFEQVQHERYGHSAGPIRQPFIDGAHFFGSAILLPYQMALDPPWECEYALGYYRPGSCAPYHIPPFPFSPRAAMAQAGFVVGGIYVIP